jgi:hypothetical protein
MSAAPRPKPRIFASTGHSQAGQGLQLDVGVGDRRSDGRVRGARLEAQLDGLLVLEARAVDDHRRQLARGQPS